MSTQTERTAGVVRQRDQAIAALLTTPTIAKAAERLGVREETLIRWMRDPAFATDYRGARRAILEQAIAALQQATSEAVAALTRNLTCGAPSTEVRAAMAILDFAFRGLELLDLAERVERLEAQDAPPEARQCA